VKKAGGIMKNREIRREIHEKGGKYMKKSGIRCKGGKYMTKGGKYMICKS
jgi:hypothetical protein